MTGALPADGAPAVPAVIVPVDAPVVTAPDGLKGYAKTIATVVGTFAFMLALAIVRGDNGVTDDEWLTIGLATAAAGGFTFGTPNAQLFRATK